MIIKEIDLESINLLNADTPPAPIVEQFSTYFSRFDLTNVLVVTDEQIDSDLRVINQVRALRKFTNNITLIQIQPTSHYDNSQKKYILRKMLVYAIQNFIYLPWFLFLVFSRTSPLVWRTKAKMGILNDHSYLIEEKIDTSKYSCVITNNLISANNVHYYDNVEYIWDIHELEVFRNRSKASIQRSFYIYLNELRLLKKIQNKITISRFNSNQLKQMYRLKSTDFECIYNQNFNKIRSIKASNFIKRYLLIYIGNVALDRGLNDIIKLSSNYDILVIACNYRPEAIEYLEKNGNKNRLKIFKGMNYHQILLQSINQYEFPFFLILINPKHPSYRYALPNKFFQAQVLGCPIIVYENTYLATIVKEYQCGVVYKSRSKDFKESIESLNYQELQYSMNVIIKAQLNLKTL